MGISLMNEESYQLFKAMRFMLEEFEPLADNDQLINSWCIETRHNNEKMAFSDPSYEERWLKERKEQDHGN